MLLPVKYQITTSRKDKERQLGLSSPLNIWNVTVVIFNKIENNDYSVCFVCIKTIFKPTYFW